jgi:hypothetical protein
MLDSTPFRDNYILEITVRMSLIQRSAMNKPLPKNRHSKNHHVAASIAACLLVVTASLYAAESEWEVPQTEHGYPDLQGLWGNRTQTPFQRPANLGNKRAYTTEEAMALEEERREFDRQKFLPLDADRDAPPAGQFIGNQADGNFADVRINVARVNGEYRTSLIVDPPDGRIPYVEGGNRKDIYGKWRAQGLGAADGPEMRGVGERCITANGTMPPMAVITYNSNAQIVQTRDYVMIMGEMVNDARIIRLNSEHQSEHIKKWMGDSIGHYEGNTLVVHTQNYRAQQSNMRLRSSEQLQVTERYTPVSDTEIHYSYTIEDPEIYTREFTVDLPLNRRAPGEQLYEFACHEGNYSIPGILAGARREELNQ